MSVKLTKFLKYSIIISAKEFFFCPCIFACWVVCRQDYTKSWSVCIYLLWIQIKIRIKHIWKCFLWCWIRLDWIQGDCWALAEVCPLLSATGNTWLQSQSCNCITILISITVWLINTFKTFTMFPVNEKKKKAFKIHGRVISIVQANEPSLDGLLWWH